MTAHEGSCSDGPPMDIAGDSLTKLDPPDVANGCLLLVVVGGVLVAMLVVGSAVLFWLLLLSPGGGR